MCNVRAIPVPYASLSRSKHLKLLLLLLLLLLPLLLISILLLLLLPLLILLLFNNNKNRMGPPLYIQHRCGPSRTHRYNSGDTGYSPHVDYRLYDYIATTGYSHRILPEIGSYFTGRYSSSGCLEVINHEVVNGHYAGTTSLYLRGIDVLSHILDPRYLAHILSLCVKFTARLLH